LVGALPDSVGQMTQTFLPATLYPHVDRPAFGKLCRRLAGLAAMSSVVGGWAAWAVLGPRGAPYLARDAGMITSLRQAAPWVAIALALHPWVVVLEGAVIAQGRFGTLLRTYGVTCSLHAIWLTCTCTHLPHVWRALVLWQVSRLANYSFSDVGGSWSLLSWRWRARWKWKQQGIEREYTASDRPNSCG